MCIVVLLKLSISLYTVFVGTGKSFLINRIRQLYRPGEVVIVAPTGKAASLHNGGQTLQGHFRLGIDTTKLKTMSKMSERAFRKEREHVKCDITDEVHMCSAGVMSLKNLRTQQISENHKYVDFGGVDQVFCGDVMQLKAIGGPISNDVMAGTPIGNVIRKFKLFYLTQQMRSLDPFHTPLVNRLGDPLNYNQPLKLEDLRETCPLCLDVDGISRKPDPVDHLPSFQCPESCPHRCTHFKVINKADIAQDPDGWANAPIVTATNKTVACFNLTRARALSRRTGNEVLRFRLPPSDASDQVIPDSLVESQADFWATYITGAPVKITFNLMTTKGIVNGSEGHLCGVKWYKKSEEYLSARANYKPGEVLTLTTPPDVIFISLNASLRGSVASVIPVGSEAGPIIAIETNPSGSVYRNKRRTSIEIGDPKIDIKVISSGWKLIFATTFNGIEGATVRKLILNLNRSPSYRNCPNLPGMYI